MEYLEDGTSPEWARLSMGEPHQPDISRRGRPWRREANYGVPARDWFQRGGRLRGIPQERGFDWGGPQVGKSPTGGPQAGGSQWGRPRRGGSRWGGPQLGEPQRGDPPQSE